MPKIIIDKKNVNCSFFWYNTEKCIEHRVAFVICLLWNYIKKGEAIQEQMSGKVL